MSLTNLSDIPIAKGSRNDGKQNPFAGTDYSSMWENNPYASLYYEPTFWDNIGLSNKAKDANAEYERLYNEYIAGIYDQQREDTYNSEKSQVDRMREAGLNADLLGLSGSSSDSMTPPNAGPNTALNGVSPASSALSTIGSVLSFATSTLKSLNEIQGLSLDNISKDFGIDKLFEGRAHDVIVNEFANMFSKGDSYVGNWSDIRETSSIGLSHRERKRYTNAFNRVLNNSRYSAATSAYDRLSDNERAMYTFLDSVMKLDVLARKHNYKGSIARAIFDTDYYNSLDGKSFGNYDSSDKNNASWLNSWRSDYYSKLYNQWKNGNILSGLILIGSGGSVVSGGASVGSSLLRMLK